MQRPIIAAGGPPAEHGWLSRHEPLVGRSDLQQFA